MYPNIKEIVKNPITYFKNKPDYVCYHTKYSFEITEVSFCEEEEKVSIKYELSSEYDGSDKMYAVEEYEVDSLEFYFFLQNLYGADTKEIIPVYEEDLIGLQGEATVYVANSTVYIDTLSID